MRGIYRWRKSRRKTPGRSGLLLAWLALCGRELARAGQFVCDIEIVSGAVVLQPAAFALRGAWGNVDPSTWIWNLNMYGPGYARTYSRPNAGIVNIAIGRTVSRPWAGRAPWQCASLSAGMLSGIERQLRGEARSKSGYIMPTPDTGDRSQGPDDDGATDPLTKLREDLAAAEGRTLLAPSMASGVWRGAWRCSDALLAMSTRRVDSVSNPAGGSSGASPRC